MNYFEQHLLPEERNSIPYLSTTVHLLDFISKQYGVQIALSDESQEIRYAFLEQRIACRRHKLQSMNLKAGTNIGLYDVNSIDEVEWFLAVTTAGLVFGMKTIKTEKHWRSNLSNPGKKYVKKRKTAGKKCVLLWELQTTILNRIIL
jgi:hypothetical protein